MCKDDNTSNGYSTYQALCFCLTVLAVTCGTSLPATAQVTLQNALPNLTDYFLRSTDMQSPNDGTNRLFVTSQNGFISVTANDPATTERKVFLDISSQVFTGFEAGLLGLAFHPDYTNNGYFYIYYTADTPLRSVVSRFTVSADQDSADAASEVVLFEVNQPAGNHNAGQLAFGPTDGYLYIALGDGGIGRPSEPNPYAQDPTHPLGAILRIDVDGNGGGSDCGGVAASYTVPATNPFVDGPGNQCDEIWAYGFRNPWRFSFDPDDPTRLWVADVGHIAQEEINWVYAGQNHGWPIMEGTACWPSGTSCDPTGLTLPVWTYSLGASPPSHAVVGGRVYQGQSCAAALTGKYLYTDYVQRFLYALDYDENGITASMQLSMDTGRNISAFSVDASGELYLVHRGTFGRLYTLDCAGVLVEPSITAILSGAYTSPDMNTDLAPFVPLDQPFGDAPFASSPLAYNGSESVPVLPPDIVDWVLVQLRQTADGPALATRAALLKKDGSIVDTDGLSPVAFPVVPAPYFVVVRHRNHLSMMSAAAIDFSSGTGSFDFSTGAAQAYGSSPQDPLGDGRFGMYGGDGNVNGSVTAFDMLQIWLLQNGTTGYLQGDYNLNGSVTAFDLVQIWLKSNGFTTQVPGG